MRRPRLEYIGGPKDGEGDSIVPLGATPYSGYSPPEKRDRSAGLYWVSRWTYTDSGQPRIRHQDCGAAGCPGRVTR